jgi:Na+-driven multidrug efflux pump
MFFLLPAWGISNAAATLVARVLAQRTFLRAEQSVMQTAKFNASLWGLYRCCSCGSWPYRKRFLPKQEEVQSYAIAALRLIAPAIFFTV